MEYYNNHPGAFEKDLLCELNPKFTSNDLDILEKIVEEYDIFSATGFPNFLLEEDLSGILNILLIDALPHRLVVNPDFPSNPIGFDKIENKVVRINNVFGSYWIDQEVKKMNELINNGENKV